MARRRQLSTSETVRRSDQDLIEALRQQFELLKSACASYDSGSQLEVINIATRLRVILQGPQSLISQLKLSKNLKFRDTSTHRLDPDRNICVANIGVELMPGVGAGGYPSSMAGLKDTPNPLRSGSPAGGRNRSCPRALPMDLTGHPDTAGSGWSLPSRIRTEARTSGIEISTTTG